MTNRTPLTPSQQITEAIKKGNSRFFACDNVSEYIPEALLEPWKQEVTEKFEAVLDSLLIDRENDPNSHDTGKRMAKMYIDELFAGRYQPAPPVTAFPNVDPATRYSGMLTTRVKIHSMCSHHHQPVVGTCWIGLIPSTHVIGLSKYARLAQWLARRGTLQEELTHEIAKVIKADTHSEDVGVVVSAQHGCCSNRGIMAEDSTTTTSELHGQFFNPSVKEEFLQMIRLNKNG